MAITLDGNLGILSPDFEPSGSTTPTNGLFLPTTNALGFATNSTERLRLDASGNLGLGVTPSAWSFLKGFDISTYGGFYGYTNQAGVTSNAYYGSGGWTYKNTAAATLYQQINGQHSWQTAPSGTAGNAISFTQAMTLDASGNLLVGLTSATSGGGVLQVSNGITFPATQSASSNANTLDDYEEGTWTPSVIASVSGSVGAYSTRIGTYTKIGNTVRAYCYIVFTKGTLNGVLQLSGFPFQASNYEGATPAYFNGLATAIVYASSYVNLGAVVASMNRNAAASSSLNNAFQATDLGGGNNEYLITITYQTA